MDFFEERSWVPKLQLTEQAADYYRDVYLMHRNSPSTGECEICHVPGCPDWRDAYDKLATAGYLMADPALWRNREANEAVKT